MPKLSIVAEVTEEDKHSEDVEAVLLHDGKVYTAADDGRVKIWSTDLKLLHDIKAHDYAINHLLVIDNYLFTASVDMTIKRWEIGTWALLNTITGHGEPVRRLGTDGTHLFAGDENGEVRMWTKEGQLKVIYEVIEEVWDMHIDCNLLYCLRDKDLVVTERVGDSDKYTLIFTCHGRSPLYVKQNYVVLLDRPGRIIAVRDSTPPLFESKYELKEHELIVTTLGGWDDFLVSGGWDKKIVVWNMKSGTQVAQCQIPTTPSAIAASKDAIFIVGSGGYFGKLKLT